MELNYGILMKNLEVKVVEIILLYICQYSFSNAFVRKTFYNTEEKMTSRLPIPTLGDLPNPGIEPLSPVSSTLTSGFFTTEPAGKPKNKDTT